MVKARKGACAECKYGYKDELDDLYCVNRDSEYCTEFVRPEDGCEWWEEER